MRFLAQIHTRYKIDFNFLWSNYPLGGYTQFHQGPTHGRASTTSCLEKMLYGEIYSDSERRASNLLAFSSQPIRNQPELLLAGF